MVSKVFISYRRKDMAGVAGPSHLSSP